MANNKYDIYIGILPQTYLAEIISTDITCPLGQLTLASYAKERVSGLEAVVFDGAKTPDKKIFEEVKKHQAEGKRILAGITLNTGNTKNSFDLAKRLNSNGIDVVVGGPEATMVSEDILKNRPYLKAIVLGAGEKVMTKVLQNGSFSPSIPNTVHRTEKGIIVKTRLYPEYLKLDFKNIKIDYNLLFDLEAHNGVTYLWGNDCQNAKQRCYFCGRISLGVGFRDPTTVWSELLELYNEGVRNFYNNTDTIAVSLKELNKFVNAKPKEMTEDHHKVFINASQINNVTIPLLKRLNATVHIGIENPALYETVGKIESEVEDNEQALKYLRNAGIPSVLSFVVGMPGENEQTLAQNREYIQSVAKEYGSNIEQILISPLMLTSGSRAYHDLMSNPEMSEKYRERTPPFDVVEMSEDYFRLKTDITRRRALEWVKEIYGFVKTTHPNIGIDTKGITQEELNFLEK